MGAIPRQVGHQKAKNSTICNPPDARVYVPGSVASRFGPREVATTCGASVGASVGRTSTAGVSVGAASGWVTVGMVVGVASDSVAPGVAAGAQPTNNITVSRLIVKIILGFIILR